MRGRNIVLLTYYKENIILTLILMRYFLPLYLIDFIHPLFSCKNSRKRKLFGEILQNTIIQNYM